MSGQLPPLRPPGPQAPYSSASAYASSSAPSTVSPRSPHVPSGGSPAMGLLGPQRIPRPEVGHRPYPQPLPANSVNENSPRYVVEFEPMGGPPLQEPYRISRMMSGTPNPHSYPGGGPLQAHKRAYRQRRKDPSCDACRERKVKCDATDTSSCSECSSRNVNCQFTKETNRRMSSIKQVQDLEKQLQVARQQVSQLKSLVKSDGAAVEDDESPGPSSPNKKRKLTAPHNINSIQDNMSSCGQGIILGPSSREQSGMPQEISSSPPELPSRAVADLLCHNYRTTLQGSFPFLHWPLVMEHLGKLYADGMAREISDDAIAVVFGVLACGALRDGVERGRPFFETAKKLLNAWTESPSLSSIRAALLCAVFSTESNCKTTGLFFLGFAVRAAQAIGLHRRTGMRSIMEEDLRHRLWWSTFCLESLASLELGRPTIINNEDCEPPEERALASSPSSPPESGLQEFMIQVARTIPHIQKSFRSAVISHQSLQALDDQITSCASSVPVSHQNQPINGYFDINPIGPLLQIQSLRLLLHRHNLSPSSPLESKRLAIHHCKVAASETARILSRGMCDPSSSPSQQAAVDERWEGSLRAGSSAALCLHIWRCALILSSCGDYEGALICARSSTAIGNVRPINGCCGRYLEFFLGELVERLQNGPLNLSEDDELIAYVSGDLQSNLGQAWIWQSGDRDSPSSQGWSGSNGAVGAMESSWDGWVGVLNTLKGLLDDQKRHLPHSPQYKEVPGIGAGAKLLPRSDAAQVPGPAVSPNSSNRMSIADLI